MGDSRTVLIADDEPGIAIIFRVKLRLMAPRLGIRQLNFYNAVDGEQALEILREHPKKNSSSNGGSIDLVVLDVVMPHKDGLSVYEQMCELSPYTATLVWSVAPNNYLERARQLGVTVQDKDSILKTEMLFHQTFEERLVNGAKYLAHCPKQAKENSPAQ